MRTASMRIARPARLRELIELKGKRRGDGLVYHVAIEG